MRLSSMRLRTLLATAASSVALAGCVTSGGLHPDGAMLDPSTLQADRSLSGQTLSPAAWPAADWWTGLGDPQLGALIAEALTNNPGLDVADARARQAQASAGLADAERSPTVNAGASVSGARIPTTLLPSDVGGGHFAWAKYGYASFNWGLDLWGGKRAAWEAAVGRTRAVDVDAQAARLELSVNVARAYAQLGYAYAQQDVANAEFKRAGIARKLTRQRVVAGLDSMLPSKQLDAEVADAEQAQAVAERAIDASRSALAVLLGEGPDRGLDIARPQLLQPATVAVPARLPLELLGHRPDLVAARWLVEATSKDIRATKAQFLPNVSIGALAGLIVLGGGNLFQAPARFYQAGPSLSLPIFDGGRLRANLAARDADYDLAAAQYNQTLVSAVNQVADDVNAAQSMRRQIDAEQRSLDAANQAWVLAQQRYQAGVGSYLEALSVRQQLLLAEQRMAALKAQQIDLSVQLIQALGGGYRPNGARAGAASAGEPSSKPAVGAATFSSPSHS